MKKVFNTSQEVAHVWASQSQETGRSRNTSFEFSRHRNVFYSYSTVIAKIIGDYVIIDRHSYSSTTAGHYSDVIHAFRNVKKVLRVHAVNSDLGPSKQLTQDEIDGLLDKASVARTKRDDYLAQAQDIADQYNTYVGLMKGSAKYRIKLDIAGFTPEKRAAALKKVADQAKRQRAAQLKERAEKIAEDIKTWRAGGYPYLPYDIPTMLRLKSEWVIGPHDTDIEKQVVQTSKSAEIPVEDAKRLWPHILRIRKSGVGRLLSMPLGSYTLRSIDKDGNIEVGCHSIAFSEIEMIAKQLDLKMEAPAEVPKEFIHPVTKYAAEMWRNPS